MYPQIDLQSVFVFILSIASAVGIGAKTKSKFVVTKNRRICNIHYGEAVTQSLAACSAVCQSSSICTAANYFAETRTCHLFNQMFYLTEDAYGWTYFSKPKANRPFHYIANATKSWGDAKQYCESIGGGLANIYTPADQEIILNILSPITLDTDGVWLGGSDLLNEGEWVWSNGSRIQDQDFDFWFPGEPNNDGNQDCLRLWDKSGIRQWDDKMCATLQNFICEIDVE